MDNSNIKLLKDVESDLKDLPAISWVLGTLLVWVLHIRSGYTLLIFGGIIACILLCIKYLISKGDVNE